VNTLHKGDNDDDDDDDNNNVTSILNINYIYEKTLMFSINSRE
jgi:hypothetical protein